MPSPDTSNVTPVAFGFPLAVYVEGSTRLRSTSQAQRRFGQVTVSRSQEELGSAAQPTTCAALEGGLHG
ncbi:MAG: hypothetical protein JWN04_6030 [Myxococcaceae bacterium]|nr:hypothetical protein [Myxococcaceae bacterium]